MKKTWFLTDYRYVFACVEKFLKIMRISFFLIALASLQTFATSNYAQSKKIDLKIEKTSITKVLEKIEKETEFFFFYNNQVVNLDRQISINLKEKTINEVLDAIFRDSNINYTILDNNRQIILSAAGNSNATMQQQKFISGKVTDLSGSSLPGVSVVVKGTTTGTITDADGKYSLGNVPENATLYFSFVGMKTQEIVVGGKTTINIKLEEETVGIEEVVAVGYGTQKRETITGSVAAVKGELLSLVPVASASNTLAGQLPGLVSLQSSGQPGSDDAALSIRGFGNALIIVDGVESGNNHIDANQIESVSILKDGASAIYGSRAGNGVILVTTKRGNMGKPMITLNSSYSLLGITAMPKPVNAGQYAEMVSEGWLQSGQNPNLVPFTIDQIKKYYAGTDPQYPNTNWYNVLVRDFAPQQQHNLSVRGGSDKIKYYGFLGYLDQQTMWKKNGGDYNRYNLQSNIDAKILDNLSLQLDIASIYESRKFPWRGQGIGEGTWQDYWNTLPIYPSTLPDPTKISFANGAGTGGAHVVTNSAISGYDNTNSKNFRGTIALNYTCKQIDGLSAKAFINYLENSSYNKIFSKPVKFYTYDTKSDIYTLAGALGSKATLSQADVSDRTITGQMSLTYDHTFAKDHHITALAIYEAIDYSNNWLTAGRINFLTPAIEQLFAGSTTGMYNNGAASEMGRVSYIGRLNYSYKDKYLVESSIRKDGSAKFPSDKRWGYFPSVSLGWRINEESFMKNLESLDNLKLRVSYGKSGLDNVGNFAFMSGYAYGGTYLLGPDAQQGLNSTGIANPNLTWENIAISNIGIDFSLWKRKLYGEADAFYRTLTGIPTSRIATLPSTFGGSLPPENINSLNDRGFEFKIGTSGSINDLAWDISGNISWSRSKWDHFEEPEYTDPDQARLSTRSGRWTDISYGYVSDELFTSQSQIDALTFNQDNQGNKSLRPGDIRYKDINLDGKLDWKDQVEIGKGNVPHWMMGFNTNLKYRNFSLNALFQGAFGYYTFITLVHALVAPVQFYELRWTQTNNNPNALVPRLGGAGTNGLPSDYYYKKAGYIRLKSLSLGYDLPQQWLQKIQLSQVKIYVAGTNLLTFDKLKKYGLDPEAPTGQAGYYYPQQRTISLGANISF